MADEIEDQTEETAGAAGADDAAAKAQESIEARARLYGWKDKSEFDRPPERWKPAEEFLATQEQNLPVLKENLHRIESKLTTTEATNRDLVERVGALTAAFDAMKDMAWNAEKNAFERAKREFETQKRSLENAIDDAAKNANVDGARAAREALASLREPAAPKEPVKVEQKPAAARAEPTADAAETAAVKSFTASEKWFQTPERKAAGVGDPDATGFASAKYSQLQADRPDLTHAERLSEVRKAVSKRFPELFDNPAAGEPARVATPKSGGGGSSRNSGKKTWADIPAADRALADKMIGDVNRGRKDGKTMTQGEYAQMYWNGQG